jgi:hypothetical protein
MRRPTSGAAMQSSCNNLGLSARTDCAEDVSGHGHCEIRI